jgi:hypothetical protein
MTDPVNIDEYNTRFKSHQWVEGYLEQTTIHLPCPFCAAAEWMAVPLLDMRVAMARGAMCVACGRSAKTVFHTSGGNELRFEIVQTGGSDPPDWHRETIPIRRI